MSLINQMLKDLDARHESEIRNKLHREVRPLPAAAGNSRRGPILGGGLLLVAALGGWFAYDRFAAGDAPVPASPAALPPVAAVAPVAVPPPESAAAALPSSTPASALAEAVPAPVVADANSGLKLSAALDNPPAEPPPRRAASRIVPPVDKPAEPARSREPAAKPAPSADPVIEKTPAVKSANDRAEADYRRALGLVGSARTAEAVDLLLDALRQNGGHVAARQLLARLLIEQRRHDEAMAILAEGLAAQPGQIQWATMLARLLVDRGDLGAAARTLQGSQSFATGNADYQGFAGFIAHRLGRQKEAAEYYQAAVRIAPGEGRWWLGLGLAMEADQRVADAREAFLRARASGTLNADLVAIVDQKLR
ncbi:MAG: tetratricopeptide repeat protein [Rhodocyclales bacterium]|nr:tetratricopeptide repeat protein [Rhodocyclales bacterium]